ncbi:hypothetical protein HPP92_018081 [Vanilla planifolia]|uniref:Uncharacterized protein n=1 Tax=Vanilla planifolia TaxID=51239 RepID=A0A835Q987_VANPL|nr:hypothetical protein HPP92_018081 [Vanilla planifolia]
MQCLCGDVDGQKHGKHSLEVDNQVALQGSWSSRVIELHNAMAIVLQSMQDFSKQGECNPWNSRINAHARDCLFSEGIQSQGPENNLQRFDKQT